MLRTASVQRLPQRLCSLLGTLHSASIRQSRRSMALTACRWPPPPSSSATSDCRTHRTLHRGGSRPVQLQPVRGKKDETNLSALFKPVPVKASPGDVADVVGAELCGQLDKGELLKLLNRFTQKRETKQLCLENGLDSELFD